MLPLILSLVVLGNSVHAVEHIPSSHIGALPLPTGVSHYRILGELVHNHAKDHPENQYYMFASKVQLAAAKVEWLEQPNVNHCAYCDLTRQDIFDATTEFWKSMNLFALVDLTYDACVSFFDEEWVEETKEIKFDLFILDNYSWCSTPLINMFRIKKFLYYHPLAIYYPDSLDLLGMESNPNLYPQALSSFQPGMTFLERLMNHGFYLYLKFSHALLRYKRDGINETYGIPPMGPLEENRGMHLVFSGYPIEWSRPLAPNVIMAGPPPQKAPADISDPELLKWLEGYDTVVYYSTGTVFIPAEDQIEIVKKVFARLEKKDIGVLWNFTGELSGLSSNVKVMKWVPQIDLLHNPKVKLFFSHGGLNSLYETIRAHVPMLATPYFFDHPHYAAAIEREQIGKQIKTSEWDVDFFEEQIMELLTNDIYIEKIAMVDSIIQSLYNSVETFKYWVDFTLKYETSSLWVDHHQDMYLFQRWGLDVYLSVIFVLYAMFYWAKSAKNKLCSQKLKKE
mmetsp:Transcript_1596/g.1689  ORF Transcript_1596/g.1689 Transcript_1596/m.1689 type:complete len:509 (+) Transcript_1596:181-1707(+)|eukprot:CAMPEP_0115000666 /NCGR_PEP_ID=MMETSP0216-20121206/16896_1 /TAXON_ID=223996 /ORGANISM="Protocruzia adherens, Strain Boccale" /LENGTH=508 /DNA_ID=CAMNT_0002365813 /DNA_START=102 /DNA_END=1628 /DNA_ORIENTATION=-